MSFEKAMVKICSFINDKFSVLTQGIQKIYSKFYYRYLRRKLYNRDFSLFSSNCYAGLIYHRLGLQFKSPTINLLFPSKKQYLKFLSNLKYYLSITPVEVKDENYNCPVGMIDDVKLVFNHYKSFNEAVEKWEDRKHRVNYDNLYYIFDDIADAEYNDLLEFNKLHCKGKVILTAKEYDDMENTVVIKKYKKAGKMEAYLLDKSVITGKTPADKVFDFVSWLNH